MFVMGSPSASYIDAGSYQDIARVEADAVRRAWVLAVSARLALVIGSAMLCAQARRCVAELHSPWGVRAPGVRCAGPPAVAGSAARGVGRRADEGDSRGLGAVGVAVADRPLPTADV